MLCAGERSAIKQNIRQPQGGNTLSGEILCIAGGRWLEGINQKGGKSHVNGPMLALNRYQIEHGRLWTGQGERPTQGWWAA